MLIPAVPTFTAQDVSVQNLQQLSTCVAFLSCSQDFPLWHLYKGPTLGQGFTATTYTGVTWPNVAIDTDHVVSGTGANITINTTGYYVMEACIPFQTQASGYAVQALFVWTAGPSNPHFASGTTKQFGVRSGESQAATGANEVICIDDICPVVCYIGDTLAVNVWASVGATIDSNVPVGATQGRCVCSFSGRWVRTGS